jgi:two-component system cell cycle sensor histidine kinase/response regulator CckA
MRFRKAILSGEKVEMIRSAGSSAADLVRQLLAFSRQQMIQPVVLDVQKIIQRTQSMLERIIGENIEFQVFVEDSVGFIKADPGQIEQVLLNLAAIARDALPKGGRTSNVELDAKSTTLSFLGHTSCCPIEEAAEWILRRKRGF